MSSPTHVSSEGPTTQKLTHCPAEHEFGREEKHSPKWAFPNTLLFDNGYPMGPRWPRITWAGAGGLISALLRPPHDGLRRCETHCSDL